MADKPAVFIDNLLLDSQRRESLVPNLDRLVWRDDGPLAILSTSKAYPASATRIDRLPADIWTKGRTTIGPDLFADLFTFRRDAIEAPESLDALEMALMPMMPTTRDLSPSGA